MNPSRQFILRPVATTLFMAAILLSGFVAYRLLPQAALPELVTVRLLTARLNDTLEIKADPWVFLEVTPLMVESATSFTIRPYVNPAFGPPLPSNLMFWTVTFESIPETNCAVAALERFPVGGFILRDASLRDAPQDEVHFFGGRSQTLMVRSIA